MGRGGAHRAGCTLAAVVLLVAAAPSEAQLRVGEVPIENILELVQLERVLLAIDAESGGQNSVSLELGEQVVSKRSRGRVGVVVTDRRMLTVGVGSATWNEERYQIGEATKPTVELGDRVALLVTNKRVLGFSSRDSELTEYRIGPHERVLTTRVGANAAVAVTSRQALGLSAATGGFVRTDFHLRERLVEVSPRANLTTIRTNRRLLIFRAPTASWEERRLNLSDSR
jgi:hypothetical protein